jgi:hypothetical protein
MQTLLWVEMWKYIRVLLRVKCLQRYDQNCVDFGTCFWRSIIHMLTFGWVWLRYMIPFPACTVLILHLYKRGICALHLHMCTTSAYAVMHTSGWPVFRSSYLQRFHTPWSITTEYWCCRLHLWSHRLTMALWWNSIGCQFAFFEWRLASQDNRRKYSSMLLPKVNWFTNFSLALGTLLRT